MKLYDYKTKQMVEAPDDLLDRHTWMFRTRSNFEKHLHIPYCERDDKLCFSDDRASCEYFRDFIKELKITGDLQNAKTI